MEENKNIEDPKYVKNVYNALKSKVDGFNKTEQEFNESLKDEAYVMNVHNALSKKINGFNKTSDEFKTLMMPLKKKDGTKVPSTSTTKTPSTGSVQTSGSSATQEYEYVPEIDPISGKEVYKLDASGKLIRSQEKVLKGYGTKREEQLLKVDQLKAKASKPIINNALIKKHKEKTTIPQQEIEAEKASINSEMNNEGAWNKTKTAFRWMGDVIENKVAPLLGKEINPNEGKAFIEEEKQAIDILKKELKVDDVSKINPKLIVDKTKEIVLNKRIDSKNAEKNNEFLSTLSEEEKNALELDKVNNWKTLQDKDKYLAVKGSMVVSEYEQIAKDAKVTEMLIKESEKQGKQLSPEFLQHAEDVLIKHDNAVKELNILESEIINNTENIGSTEDEIDFFGRNYSNTDKFINIAKLGIADIYMAYKKSGLLISDLDQAIFEPLRPGSSEGIMSEQERQDLINETIDWETAKNKSRSRFKRDVEFDNLSINNFGQFFNQEFATQAANFLQMALPGGITSLGMTSTFNKYSEMEQESNLESFVFDGKEKSGYTKEDGTLVDSEGNVYKQDEVTIAPTIKRQPSKANMFLTSVAFGSADALLGSLPTKNIFTRSLKKMTTGTERTLFNLSSKQFYKNKAAGLADDIITEEFSELGTTLSQNVADIMSGKKDVNVLDNFGRTITTSGMIGLFVGGSPVLAGIVINKFSSNKSSKQVNKNIEGILNLQQALNADGISESSIKAIENQIKTLEKSNNEIIKGSIKRIESLPVEVVDAIIKTDKQQELLKFQAQEIKDDPKLSDDVKKTLLEGLESEFSTLEKKRVKLVSDDVTVLDSMSDSESLKYKEKAAKELLADAKSKGLTDTQINFTEEQINEKAIEIYNNSKPKVDDVQENAVTDEEQSPQPQAEVKEKEQEVLGQSNNNQIKEPSDNNGPKEVDADIPNPNQIKNYKKLYSEEEVDAYELKYDQEYNEITDKIDKELKEKGITSFEEKQKEYKKDKRIILNNSERQKLRNHNNNILNKSFTDAIENIEVKNSFLTEGRQDRIKEKIKQTLIKRFGVNNNGFNMSLNLKGFLEGKELEGIKQDIINSFLPVGTRFNDLTSDERTEALSKTNEIANSFIKNITNEIVNNTKNESTQGENNVSDGNSRIGVEPLGEMGEAGKQEGEVDNKENVQPINESKPTEGEVQSIEDKVKNALSEIEKGVLEWSGNINSPRIDLGISWSDIRKGEKDLKRGKVDSVPAKRLLEAFDKAQEEGGYRYKLGTGGNSMRSGEFVTFEDMQRANNQYQLTDNEIQEINEQEDKLSQEYDDYFNSLETEVQNEILENYENKPREIEGNSEKGESKNDVPNKKGTRKTKSERINISNAKVDDIRNSIKGIESIFGIKIKVDDIDGINQNGINIVDTIASIVKQAIAAGIEIDEAMSKTIEHLKKTLDFDVDVNDIKAKLNPKQDKQNKEEKLSEFKKEAGKKSLLNRLAEGTNKIIKEAIKDISLNYEVSKIEDAKNLATEIFEKIGLEESTIAVADRNSGIQGDVRAFLYQKVSNDITGRISALKESIDAKSIEEFNFLMDALAKIKEEMDISSRDAGRFINALQYVYNGSEGDFSLSKMVKKWENASGEKISDELIEKFAEANKKIIELEKALFDLAKQKEKQEAQQELDIIIDDIENPSKPKPKKKYAVSKEKRDLRAKLKKEILKDYFGGLNDATRFVAMLADPKVIKYLKLTLEENAGDFVDFSKTLIDDFGKDIRKYTKDFFLKAGGLETEITDFKNTDLVVDEDGNIHIPRAVLLDLIEQGYTEIDALSEKIIEILKEDYPDQDFTIREVRDAITKYGKIIKPTENELVKQLGKMNRLGRLISQLEDAKSGKRPKKSGLQREKPSDLERKMKREVDDILRDLNIPLTDSETEIFIKSQQDKIKTRLENEIRDLDNQIENKEKRKNIKNPVEYSKENKALKEERDAKKEELDALVGKPELTEEQKIERAEAFLEKNIEKLENQILNQTVEFKERPTPLDSERLTELRKKRDSLKEEVAKIREAKGLIEARRLKNAKKYRVQKIAEYKRRLKEKDFDKKERKPLPVDKELEQIQDELDGIKEVFDTEVYKNELKKEKTIKTVFKNIFYGITSLPRTALASAEASYVAVQNGYFMIGYIPSDLATYPKRLFEKIKSINELYKQSASKGFVPMLKAIKDSESMKKSVFLDSLRITAKAMGSADVEVDIRKEMQKQTHYNSAIKSGLQITRTDGKLDAKQEMYLNDVFVTALDVPGYVLDKITKGKKYVPIGRKYINYVRKAIGKEAMVGEEKTALEQVKNINIQRVTERGMVALSNFNMMKHYSEGAEILELLGKNKIDDANDFKELANAINNMSGRSGIYLPFKIKNSNYYSPDPKVSGLLFFSFKLAATYINTMNPLWFASLGNKGKDWYKPSYSQKLVLGTMAKFYATTTAFGLLYSLAIAGEDDDNEKSIYKVGYIEKDLRSTNFGRIYQGNGVWIDPYLGKLQSLILGIKFFSGEEKNKYTGDITTIGKATENKRNRFDLLSSYASNKLSPAARIPYDYMTGELERDEITGKDKLLTGFEREEFDLGKSVFGNIPMYWTTLSDLSESEQERELYNKALYASLFAGYPGVSIDTKYKTTDYDISKLKTEELQRRNNLVDIADDLKDEKMSIEQANKKIDEMYDGMLVKDKQNAIKSINSTILKRGSEEVALKIVNQTNKKARAILLYDAYGDLGTNASLKQINEDFIKLDYNLAEDDMTIYYYNEIRSKKNKK